MQDKFTKANKRDRQTKIAYLLLVHNNPEQLNLFIKQILVDPECDIYIHVDKKNQSMIKKIMINDRIIIVSEYEVKWASFEMIAATILLMRVAIESGKNYSYIYYGSGNDLLTQKGLHNFLDANPDKLYMAIFGEITSKSPIAARYRICWSPRLMVRNDWHPYRMIRWLYHLLFRFGIIVNKNRNQINFTHIYRGSQWFIIPLDVVEYLVSYIDNNPQYIEYWRHSLAPDEFFFHTIILNSKFSKKIESSLMYINISKKFMEHNHPLTITMDRINIIEKSGCFCARKFDIHTDREVVDYFLNKTM